MAAIKVEKSQGAIVKKDYEPISGVRRKAARSSSLVPADVSTNPPSSYVRDRRDAASSPSSHQTYHIRTDAEQVAQGLIRLLGLSPTSHTQERRFVWNALESLQEHIAAWSVGGDLQDCINAIHAARDAADASAWIMDLNGAGQLDALYQGQILLYQAGLELCSAARATFRASASMYHAGDLLMEIHQLEGDMKLQQSHVKALLKQGNGGEGSATPAMPLLGSGSSTGGIAAAPAAFHPAPAYQPVASSMRQAPVGLLPAAAMGSTVPAVPAATMAARTFMPSTLLCFPPLVPSIR